MANVVVNTVVRMLTRKAVGRAMKSAKKGKASRGPRKQGKAKVKNK
jgi:hypothetical protein